MLRYPLFLILIFSIAYAQENLRAPVALLRSGTESGAAFIVGEQGGQLYLLTAAHVIDDAQDLRLSFRGNYRVRAEVVNTDSETDLAAIRCPIPAGMLVPASYLSAGASPVFDQRVRVVGHPLGEDWDIISGTVKDPIGLSGRFSITPTGIDRGCSGGPVLTANYELLGMVQQDEMQKAWCRGVQTLTTACQIWRVPVNLLTGIPEAAPTLDPDEVNHALQLQRANSAFQAQAWERAKTAYQQVYALRPSADIQQRIRTCEAEIEQDRSYNELYSKGLAASDLSTALDYYQQAQQVRNTADIQRLIAETQEVLTEIQPETVETTPSQPSTDPLAGTMLLIRGGTFTMGSSENDIEKPTHSVTVGDFYLGAYELTQSQWKAVLGTNPSNLNNCDRCPVEQVSWNDIQRFLQKLNQQTGQQYRLPTEAEWEYAAGGGSSDRTKWAGTNSERELGDYAWYLSNNDHITHPVGEKKPNRLGLYDMSGNVWEWCSDWYGNYSSGAQTNPTGPSKGSRRVNRGSGWFDKAGSCRVADRGRSNPRLRNNGLGFRLARSF